MWDWLTEQLKAFPSEQYLGKLTKICLAQAKHSLTAESGPVLEVMLDKCLVELTVPKKGKQKAQGWASQKDIQWESKMDAVLIASYPVYLVVYLVVYLIACLVECWAVYSVVH